jgi:hypothetical protein
MTKDDSGWILRLFQDHFDDDEALAHSLGVSKHILDPIDAHHLDEFLGDCLTSGRLNTAEALLRNPVVYEQMSEEAKSRAHQWITKSKFVKDTSLPGRRLSRMLSLRRKSLGFRMRHLPRL